MFLVSRNLLSGLARAFGRCANNESSSTDSTPCAFYHDEEHLSVPVPLDRRRHPAGTGQADQVLLFQGGISAKYARSIDLKVWGGDFFASGLFSFAAHRFMTYVFNYVLLTLPAKPKRQTDCEAGTQSHGALRARQAAEVCNPRRLQSWRPFFGCVILQSHRSSWQAADEAALPSLPRWQ